MTDTPNTQAVLQAADGRWTYSIKHFCESMELRIKELENERDTALDDLEFRRGLFQLQEQQLNAVRAERDRLAVALDVCLREMLDVIYACNEEIVDANDTFHQAIKLGQKTLAAVKGGGDE